MLCAGRDSKYLSEEKGRFFLKKQINLIGNMSYFTVSYYNSTPTKQNTIINTKSLKDTLARKSILAESATSSYF